MNDNLPEINFKEKKEKKRGIVGWFKSRLGLGSRGGAMGEAGISPSAMNVGRALGTAKFGAAGGLAGFFAGNAGLIATVAMVAVATGVYLANNAPAPSTGTGAFSSGKTDNYVPAILRGGKQGSSLDMFKDTNRGAGLSMEAADPAKAAADKAAADKAAADKAAADSAGGDSGQPAPEQNNMSQDMMGKLQGGSMGSLTNSLGSGASKFSSMGGFNNKFNQGAVGAKTGFSSGIGSGFAGMPRFDQRKGKMLAMKSSARPVFSGSKAGKKGQFGAGSFGQAKGMRDMQKSYTGTNVDSARSTQDKAWEGSTAEGDAGAGGAGLGDGGGGAGVMTSPSLDNGSGGGGGGAAGTAAEPVIPEASSPANVSPWASLVTMIMVLVLVSAILSFIASKLSGTVFGYPIAVIVAGIAAMIAGIALVMSIMLMAQYGQALLGSLYLIGSGLALAAAVAALAGGSEAVMAPGPATTVMWLAAGAGVITLMGSMFAGK